MKRTIPLMLVAIAAVGLIGLVGSRVAGGMWTAQATVPEKAVEVEQPAALEGAEPAAPQDAAPASEGFQGTIIPPGCEGITITETGEYSVCGVAILSVVLQDIDIKVLASIEPYPTDAGKVLAGTINLGCLLDGKPDMGPHDVHAQPKICFAAPPDKDVQVKFYDEAAKAWVGLETTVSEGQACVPANYSGRYVLVEK
jgi:hypothetical protein